MPILIGPAPKGQRGLIKAVDGESYYLATHDERYETVRRHGVSPDDFIHSKVDEFAKGNSGLPGRQ